MKILIIEDHASLAQNLVDYFSRLGHTLDCAANGVIGLHLAITGEFDAIILDISLPGLDGLEVCRKIREEAHLDTPIIMLTARDTLDDRVAGLNIGADDYLVKPFELKELNARIEALVRRTKRHWSGGTLSVSDLIFDTHTMTVKRADQSIKMPPLQLKLLKYLMLNTHRVVSSSELEQVIWGDEPPVTSALRTHLHTLRQLIDKPFAKPLLKTITGFGYRLTDEE